MNLSDELKGLIAESEKAKDDASSSAREAAARDQLEREEEAVAALTHLLSDESIKVIVSETLKLGGKHVATLAVKNGPVTLHGSHQRTITLPITFTADPFIAAQVLNTKMDARRNELRKLGIVVDGKLAEAPALVIVIDFTRLK